MVRVFWAGEWRKVVVDDRLPFDVASGRLFPGSAATNELWPALMYKAWLQLTNSCVATRHWHTPAAAGKRRTSLQHPSLRATFLVTTLPPPPAAVLNNPC